jgi:hypothetical protein
MLALGSFAGHAHAIEDVALARTSAAGYSECQSGVSPERLRLNIDDQRNASDIALADG